MEKGWRFGFCSAAPLEGGGVSSRDRLPYRFVRGRRRRSSAWVRCRGGGDTEWESMKSGNAWLREMVLTGGRDTSVSISAPPLFRSLGAATSSGISASVISRPAVAGAFPGVGVVGLLLGLAWMAVMLVRRGALNVSRLGIGRSRGRSPTQSTAPTLATLRRDMSDEERRVDAVARTARERLRKNPSRGSADASTVLEACGDDEAARTIVFRMTVFRERVLEAIRPTWVPTTDRTAQSTGPKRVGRKQPLTRGVLRRLLWERRGWKLTPLEVIDVVVELATDLAMRTVVPEVDRATREELGVDLLVISQVLLRDVVRRSGKIDQIAAFTQVADHAIVTSFGFAAGTAAELRREVTLGVYRRAVREIVQDYGHAPSLRQFTDVSSMLRLTERDIENIIANEGGLGIRDCLEEAASYRRQTGSRTRALDTVIRAVRIATYLLKSINARSKSLAATCDKYLRGAARSVGMESQGLLEDFAVEFGSDVLVGKLSLEDRHHPPPASSPPQATAAAADDTTITERFEREDLAVLRRLLASPETNSSYARAFQSVLKDAIRAELFRSTDPRVVVRLREAMELPGPKWIPAAEEVLRGEAQSPSVTSTDAAGRPSSSFASHLDEVAFFLGIDPRHVRDEVVGDTLTRKLDAVFAAAVEQLPGRSNSDPTAHDDETVDVDIDGVVSTAERLGLSSDATIGAVAPVCERWLTSYLRNALFALSHDDVAAMCREMRRASSAISSVVVPLFLGLGHAGADRHWVASRVSRSAAEVRLRALQTAYENAVGADTPSAEILREYIFR